MTSHVARDWKDTNLVQEHLEDRNPFDYGQELYEKEQYFITSYSKNKG